MAIRRVRRSSEEYERKLAVERLMIIYALELEDEPPVGVERWGRNGSLPEPWETKARESLNARALP